MGEVSFYTCSRDGVSQNRLSKGAIQEESPSSASNITSMPIAVAQGAISKDTRRAAVRCKELRAFASMTPIRVTSKVQAAKKLCA